jgi:hypothetical protein
LPPRGRAGKMLKGNRCELCSEKIKFAKARHKQTKYCEDCAKIKKRQNTLNPWLPEEQREYMRNYMRDYRRSHPKLSTRYVRKHRERKRDLQAGSSRQAQTSLCCLVVGILPFLLQVDLPSEGINLRFETIRTVISHIDIIVVEVTGLVVIVSYSLKHLVDIWKRKK